MPLDELQNIRKRFSNASADVHIVTFPSVMHACAWVFRTTDIQTLNSIGEMDYADWRASRENRRPFRITTQEFVRHLRNKKRKDVICIFRTGRGVKGRGLSTSEEYIGKYLSARFYPGQKKKATQGAGQVK